MFHRAGPILLGPLTWSVLAVAAGPSWRTTPPPAEPADEQPARLPKVRPGPRMTVPPLPPQLLRHGPYQSVQVNVDAQGRNIVGDAANEPSLAVDPTNPNRIAIGWRQFDSIQSDFREAGWAYSRDAGRSWTFPGVLEPNVFRSDPVLAANTIGELFYYSLTQDFKCQVFKSANGGRSWGPPVPAEGGDKGWMEIDRTDGPGRGAIYCFSRIGVSTTIGLTRSLDGGRSFSPNVVVPGNPGRGTLALGLDSVLFAAGISWDNNRFVCARSSNAYDPQATPRFDSLATVDLGGQWTAYVGPNPGGLVGQVWVACDVSEGPQRGYVYVLCSVDPPGADPLDVLIARSTDGGRTWQPPVRVNDDAPGTNAWQWFGTMDVSPNGRLDVVWADTRHFPGSYRRSELFYSYSTDGGATWAPNVQVSPDFDSYVGWPQQNKIGDYYHLRSDKVGTSLAYAATFNGEQDVYYLRVGEFDCNGNGLPDSEDLSSGRSKDRNHNNIPDECDGLGDLNCDNKPNNFDIDPFVLALTDPAGYHAAYPDCDIQRADINGDGAVNNLDIDPFVQLLTGK